MNTDRIKDKIRKLLNVASNDASQGAEIDNAVRAARALMMAHHIEEDDLGQEDQAPTMGRSTSRGRSTRSATWENYLSSFVARFVGSVGVYKDTERGLKDGKAKMFSAFTFYGLDSEVQLANEIFQEISTVIVTMATSQYGSWFRGDGAAYAEEFVRGLRKQMQQADEQTIGTEIAVRCTALMAQKKREATQWLRRECGVRLSSYSGSGGSRTGSGDARSAGRADGKAYDLGGKRDGARRSVGSQRAITG